MTDKPSKSHGRKTVRVSVKPRSLMDGPADLAGVWTARIVTLFPDAFPGVLGASLTGKALKEGKWQLQTTDLRLFGDGKHRNVDDTPAGGGAGMVLRPDVVGAAIEHAHRSGPILYMSPRGTPLTQEMAADLARGPGCTILCGRFEGVDQRAIYHYGMREVSIGDYVLTGGELAAQVLIDATVRLLPGVLGNEASTEDESHSNGLLEHPQYTRPAEWRGQGIPEVLTSGHHGKVADWRQDQSERLTQERRPDMWDRYTNKDG
ncbi:tRNA (guanosine(37)-N1)-methyltransferase TrmD [Shimia ponticola]|uniref:tRNA (guanosine(37)-N1)-methyltransferase TrmD n=1 Tax=Shimia ponticola TaxID=2582893 RepID=UPI0011BE8C9B|nr:tRNA (guanosine(37)-N1)-methyltransferase TrmD [Shimia ponticola]